MSKSVVEGGGVLMSIYVIRCNIFLCNIFKKRKKRKSKKKNDTSAQFLVFLLSLFPYYFEKKLFATLEYQAIWMFGKNVI